MVSPSNNDSPKVLSMNNGARILCLADVRGHISLINEIAAQTNATAVIHTGDFGFYDKDSVDRISEKTLRHVIQYSPLIPFNLRSKFSTTQHRTASNSLRQTIHSHPDPIISELPLFLNGTLSLKIPVYTVWGACEDIRVIEAFRKEEYKIPNLHIIDEHESHLLDVGGIHLRLLGLGGSLVLHKLFDNGEGRSTIAGEKGTMWTTVLQMGELIETAQRVHDDKETRILITHASPGREGLLNQLALTVKADFTLSAGLHFRYGSSYNEFSVYPSADHFHSKLISARGAFMDVWETVKAEVEPMVQDTQKQLLENVLNAIKAMPSKSGEYAENSREDTYLKNLWNFNLPDASFGHTVLDISDGRMSAETKAQGFNFSYRRQTKQSHDRSQPRQFQNQPFNYTPRAIADAAAISSANQATAPAATQAAASIQGNEKTLVSQEAASQTSKAPSHNNKVNGTLGTQSAQSTPNAPVSTPSGPEYALWVSPAPDEATVRGYFAEDDRPGISGVKIFVRTTRNYAYVFFKTKEASEKALDRYTKKEGLLIREKDARPSGPPQNTFFKKNNSEESARGRGGFTRGITRGRGRGGRGGVLSRDDGRLNKDSSERESKKDNGDKEVSEAPKVEKPVAQSENTKSEA